MQSRRYILLGGVRRSVTAEEQEPLRRSDDSLQRRVRVDFEVLGADHTALGRELHLALDGRPLRDEQGIDWQAVSMSSRLSGIGLRTFTVDLVEL